MQNPAQQIDLRPVTENDAQLLFKLMTGKNWLKQIGDKGIKSEADAKQYILDKIHPDLNEKGFVNHVIIDRESRIEVGTCSIHDREGIDGLDIGYAILEEYEDQGYATSAAQKVVEMAFDHYHVEQLNAITTDQNKASCRVLEKLGFEQSGYVVLPDGKEELKLYNLEKPRH